MDQWISVRPCSKENIRSMMVVTASGRTVRTRQAVRKASTGYELNALYLGAEGEALCWLGLVSSTSTSVHHMIIRLLNTSSSV